MSTHDTTKRRKPITFEIVPGTDIEEIKAAHPDWTEEECHAEQSRVALAAFMKGKYGGR